MKQNCVVPCPCLKGSPERGRCSACDRPVKEGNVRLKTDISRQGGLQK